MSWLQRLSQGLAKTRDAVRGSLDRLIGRGPDPAALDELEAALITADLGVHTVQRLMERVQTELRRRDFDASDPSRRLLLALKDTIQAQLRGCEGPPVERLIEQGSKPYVILAVGVNGVGKTTTVAKLAQRLRQGGKAPLLVAADTFRAAAIEQLEAWGKRVGVDVVRHHQGADPSAVVFDGLSAAKARAADVVLIDTAGRLHTKANLMDELKKMKRVLARELPGAPHEVLLVVDATVGQNALSQARLFNDAVGVTGIVLTKLDGTARGGIVVAIAEELKIPVRLIGVGEAVEDLQDFHAREFVDALFEPA
ncbi:MAG: signal recognition particle-docking protein FtsY [Nitrospirae bacterium]|nr:MAG: signal recognition particle-docking protein FtsY [Nitrospirota bacterium]